MKAFFKEKGLYLFCLTLVFAATVVGILAIRTVVRNVSDLTRARQDTLEEEPSWNIPDAAVNNPVTDLPQSTLAPSAPSSASGSSSGSSSQPDKSSVTDGGTSAPLAPSAALPALPTDADPIQPYSGDTLVYNETLGDWRTHNGADYAVPAGTSIPAITAGTVTAVYEDPLWGGVVEIADKRGNLWKYCGVDDPAVRPQETVQQGAALGTAGVIPSESKMESHLHLELTREEKWLDPETEF
ncbi:MAG: peptidoglycan DD-metalloendopeptidase family protein [Gemmiger sp.]